MERQKQKTIKTLLKLLLPPPDSIYATTGDLNGEIDLVWEPVKGASNYIIQYSSGTLKNSSWRYLDVVTKSSHTLTNLKHGKNYRFRVAAVSSKGRGLWSKAVIKKVM